MADLLTRSHPLEPYLTALDDLPDGLRITAEPFVALAGLRVDPASGVQISLGSSGVPETFVVDTKGVIRYQHIGEIKPADAPLLLQKLREAQ